MCQRAGGELDRSTSQTISRPLRGACRSIPPDSALPASARRRVHPGGEHVSQQTAALTPHWAAAGLVPVEPTFRRAHPNPRSTQASCVGAEEFERNHALFPNRRSTQTSCVGRRTDEYGDFPLPGAGQRPQRYPYLPRTWTHRSRHTSALFCSSSCSSSCSCSCSSLVSRSPFLQSPPVSDNSRHDAGSRATSGEYEHEHDYEHERTSIQKIATSTSCSSRSSRLVLPPGRRDERD